MNIQVNVSVTTNVYVTIDASVTRGDVLAVFWECVVYALRG